MLYILMLAVIFIWMVMVIRKKQPSWHSIALAYAIGVTMADLVEVSFNLLLGLYKFQTRLSANPIYENELGIVLADTLILPFTFIIFIYYVKREHPWRASLPFALTFIVLEYIFLKFGYLEYIHWNFAYSAAFYIGGFRFIAYLAPRIINYDPPIPYFVRLLCFGHMIIMWVGAAFSLPLLKLYQFRPGVFKDIMADCRFTDLLSGDVLAIICALLIPKLPNRLKPLAFIVISCIGVSFALYAYVNGWLIYHRWNHFFMVLRYFVPIFLIMLYDRWELSYKNHRSYE